MSVNFIAILAFLFSFNIAFSTDGPEYLSVSLGMEEIDGIYMKVNDFGHCDCWENETLNTSAFINNDQMSLLFYTGPCEDGGSELHEIHNQDLFEFGCDVTAVEGIDEYFPEDPPAIPTLSQWGLIILGFILSIFGIVAIRTMIQNFSRNPLR